MRPKYKVTGCARFFVFLIIFLPIVYFGAAYLRGEDGIQKLKDFYNGIVGNKGASDKNNDPDTYRIEDLKEDLNNAKEEIRELKAKIREQEQEIKDLKARQ